MKTLLALLVAISTSSAFAQSKCAKAVEDIFAETQTSLLSVQSLSASEALSIADKSDYLNNLDKSVLKLESKSAANELYLVTTSEYSGVKQEIVTVSIRGCQIMNSYTAYLE